MSDTQTIAPALTPEEWASLTKRGAVQLRDVRNDKVVGFCHDRDAYGRGIVIGGESGTMSFFMADSLRRIIAVANAALPDDDPRKITRASVKVLREAIESWRREQMDCADSEDATPTDSPIYRAEYALLHHLADALAAYLPPEGT